HLHLSPLSYSFFYSTDDPRDLHSFPTRRSSDLKVGSGALFHLDQDNFDGFWFTNNCVMNGHGTPPGSGTGFFVDGTRNVDHGTRSEEHTSELQSRFDLVCRLLLEKKKQTYSLSS